MIYSEFCVDIIASPRNLTHTHSYTHTKGNVDHRTEQAVEKKEFLSNFLNEIFF